MFRLSKMAQILTAEIYARAYDLGRESDAELSKKTHFWNLKKDAFDLEMTKIEEKILFLEFLFDKDVNQKIKSSEIENLEKIKNFETKMKKQKSNSEPRNKLNLNIWF